MLSPMKKPLLIILLMLFVHHGFAQADQQWLQKKYSISVRELPIEEVLKQLEKQMDGAVFAYSPNTFNVKRPITLDARDQSLQQILDEIFKDQPLRVREMSGKIFLVKKKKTSSGKQAQTPVKKKRALLKKMPKPLKEPDTATHKVVKQPETIESRKLAEAREIQKEEPLESVNKEFIDDSIAEKSQVSTEGFSPAILALQEEKGKATRQVSQQIPQRLPVKNIEINRQKARELYSHRRPLLTKPALTSIPMDTSLIQAETSKAVDVRKEKKKREKKEKPPREPEEKKFRLYVAPTGSLTQIDGNLAVKVGGRFVWLKNSRFGIGLSGSALIGGLVDDAVLNANYRVAGGYGGLLLEYNLSPHKRVHLSFPVVFALGAITYVQDGINNIGALGNPMIEDQRVLGFVEPGMLVEVNVWKYIKAGIELNYRYSTFSELNYNDSGDVILSGSGLNGFSGGLTLKVGIF